MKNKANLLIVFILSSSMYSQIISSEEFLPYSLIHDGIIDSIRNTFLYEKYRMIVFQTKIEVINDTIREPCISSIIAVNLKGKTHYWCVTSDNLIYQDKLEDDSIFAFKKYKSTGALKKESFICFNKENTIKQEDSPFPFPILRSNNIIAYEDTNICFYFEDGEDIYTYTPISKRQKYRKEWAKVIRRKLLPVFEKYCMTPETRSLPALGS